MLYSVPPAGFQPRFHVAGVFVEVDGRILLLRRSEDKPEGGTWGTPAGKLNAAEDSVTAAVRELWEETGIKVEPEELVPAQTVFVRYPDKDFVFHMYRLTLTSETPMEIRLRKGEHEDARWLLPALAMDLSLIQDLDECLRLVYGLS